MSKYTAKSQIHRTQQNHLASGGELVLPNTPERSKRTQIRSMRAKRIEDTFAAGAPVLNWARKNS